MADLGTEITVQGALGRAPNRPLSLGKCGRPRMCLAKAVRRGKTVQQTIPSAEYQSDRKPIRGGCLENSMLFLDPYEDGESCVSRNNWHFQSRKSVRRLRQRPTWMR